MTQEITLTLVLHGPELDPTAHRFAWSVTCPEIKYRATGHTTGLVAAELCMAQAAQCIVEEARR